MDTLILAATTTGTLQVYDMAKSIYDYGPFAVILGVVLSIFLIIVKNMNDTLKRFTQQAMKNDEQYKEMILNQNKTMIEQLSNTKKEIIEHQANISPQADLQETFNKLNSSIKDYCKECMDDIKAQRLGIYLFHDGTYSLNGIHFFKMSCICEKVVIGSGVRERAIEHSSIPINLFDSMIEGLMINGRYTMKRPSDDELNVYNVKIFFSSSKTSFIHIEAIYDTDNNIIGFVLAENMQEPNDELLEIQHKNIKDLIKKITPVLSFSNFADAAHAPIINKE